MKLGIRRHMSGKNIARQLFMVASAGQYGHLKGRIVFLAIFCRDTLHRTCPQGISMGELSGVLCSRDTGQANTEWNTNCLPSSSSCTFSQPCLNCIVSIATTVKTRPQYDWLGVGTSAIRPTVEHWCCIISTHI